MPWACVAEALGRGRGNALGEPPNKNVMCYLNDIYVYLRARSQDAIPRGRPPKHYDKPPEFEQAETKCMGE